MPHKSPAADSAFSEANTQIFGNAQEVRWGKGQQGARAKAICNFLN